MAIGGAVGPRPGRMVDDGFRLIAYGTDVVALRTAMGSCSRTPDHEIDMRDTNADGIEPVSG